MPAYPADQCPAPADAPGLPPAPADIPAPRESLPPLPPAGSAPAPDRRLAAVLRAFTRVSVGYVACVSLLVLAGWVLDVEALSDSPAPQPGGDEPAHRRPVPPVRRLAVAAAKERPWSSRNRSRGRPHGRGRRGGGDRGGRSCPGVACGWGGRSSRTSGCSATQLVRRLDHNRMAHDHGRLLPVGRRSPCCCWTRGGAGAGRAARRSLLRPALAGVHPRRRWHGAAGRDAGTCSWRSPSTRWRPSVPMALNTALSFSALCLGILCARPGREPMRTV